MWYFPLFVILGVGSSFVNSLAGAGSVISLPVFLWLGMPLPLAHGTNRLGLIAGAVSSFIALKKRGHIWPSQVRHVFWLVVAGSVAGALLIMVVPERVYTPILAAVLILVAFFTNPGEAARKISESSWRNNPWIRTPLLLLLGLYCGFIQVGAGLLMMFVFSLTLSWNIFQINALKGAVGAAFLLATVVVFVFTGNVHWLLGSCFAVGNYFGGLWGARFQMRLGARWVRWAVKIMAVALAVKLLWF